MLLAKLQKASNKTLKVKPFQLEHAVLTRLVSLKVFGLQKILRKKTKTRQNNIKAILLQNNVLKVLAYFFYFPVEPKPPSARSVFDKVSTILYSA